MKISEIFYSIQGEGPNNGLPTVFVRLAGCNLRCTKEIEGFDCDTPYAQDMSQGIGMSVMDVVYLLKEYDCSHLCITGGEPTLQMKEVAELVNLLWPSLDSITIETNGTKNFDTSLFSLVVISPKKGHIYMNLLRDFAKRDNVVFKFVVAEKNDVGFWLDVIDSCEIETSKTLFMPAGTTDEEIKERSLWLVEECKKHGIRYSPRLQIWLYGNERGK